MHGRVLFVVCVLAVCPGALAREDAGIPQLSTEEQEALERAMQQDAAPQQEPVPEPSSQGGFSLQSLNPDIAVVGDLALAYFTSDEPLQGGGHDPNSTGFHLQQLEVSISKSVDPYFRFDGYIVFNLFGVEVEEAYATTLALPHRLQLRAGQFLTRFGRINRMHLHAWSFVDQPFALGRVFGGEGNRGLGVEVSYLAPTPWFLEVSASVTEARGEGTARSFYGAENFAIRTPLDFQYTGTLKQFFPITDDVSLLWGLSAANGPNPTGFKNRTDIYGTDLYVKFRPISDASNPTVVSLQAEIFYRRRQVPDDLLSDWSGYTELLWRFDARWGVAGRYELGLPARTRTGAVAVDPLDPEWIRSRGRLSANLTFWATEFSRVRVQGGADFAAWRDGPDYSLMIAFEFAVGAHGAHAF